jgi:HSP20 family protein
MTLIRRTDPLRELATMPERMRRLFEDFPFAFRGREERLAPVAWAPPVDIYETEGEIVVKAEVPGMSKDDVSLEVRNGVLTLRGERKSEREVKEENYYCAECAYGTFQRSFTLPTNVDEGKTNASLKNGILEIHLPKKEEARPKQIKIAA